MPAKPTANSGGDIAIIGGGAAGLMAAIWAKMTAPNADVIIFEKNPRVGKKLLATGNGHCNLSNISAISSNYGSEDKEAVRQIINQFSVDQTLAFFESIGLYCRIEDSGRIYPRNGQASAVLDCLRLWADYLGIITVCETAIEKISPAKDSFRLIGSSANWFFRRVIISGGGKAAPKTGSNGSSLTLLADLGHRIAPVFPSLCPVLVQKTFMKALKGIRSSARATVLADGKPILVEEGEIQFTETALSGICIFNISREIGEFFTSASVQGKPCAKITVSLDLLPEVTPTALLTLLQDLWQKHAHMPLEQILAGIFHKRLAGQLLKSCGAEPLTAPAGSVSQETLQAIACRIKDWQFTPSAIASWQDAQTTAGGAVLSGFDLSDLQSKIHPGIFAAGEVLDADGRCGGFNLQWAWSSGVIAGKGAAHSL
jgi:predicted Rossmann fold flavoprotein